MINKRLLLSLLATTFLYIPSARTYNVKQYAHNTIEYLYRNPIVTSVSIVSLICVTLIGKKITELLNLSWNGQLPREVEIVTTEAMYPKKEISSDPCVEQTNTDVSEQKIMSESAATVKPNSTKCIEPIRKSVEQKTIVTVEMTPLHGDAPGSYDIYLQ